MNTLTNTEAIDKLFKKKLITDDYSYRDALDLAIKALKDNDRDCESCSEISLLGRENEKLKKKLEEVKFKSVVASSYQELIMDENRELQAKLDNQDPQLLDDALKEIARLREKIDSLPSKDEIDDIIHCCDTNLNETVKSIHKRIQGV